MSIYLVEIDLPAPAPNIDPHTGLMVIKRGMGDGGHTLKLKVKEAICAVMLREPRWDDGRENFAVQSPTLRQVQAIERIPGVTNVILKRVGN